MNRKAIICIDDEPIILNSLLEQLQNFFGTGYIYEAAESAEEGFELIEDLEDEDVEVAIIVCDWLMPGIKGDEFLMKVDLKYPHVVKILLTGLADAESVYQLKQETDLFGIIHKPWGRDELVNIIKSRLKK